MGPAHDATVNGETVVDVGFAVAATRTATGVENTGNTLLLTVQRSPAPPKPDGIGIRET